MTRIRALFSLNNSLSIVLGLASKWESCATWVTSPPVRLHLFQTHLLPSYFYLLPSVNVTLPFSTTSWASVNFPTQPDLCVNGRGTRSVLCWCSFYPVLVDFVIRSLCSGCSLLLIVLYYVVWFHAFSNIHNTANMWAVHTRTTTGLLQINRATPYANSHTIYKPIQYYLHSI